MKILFKNKYKKIKLINPACSKSWEGSFVMQRSGVGGSCRARNIVDVVAAVAVLVDVEAH